MILILSTSREHSTDTVADWISSYNKKFIRVTENDLIELQTELFSGNRKINIGKNLCRQKLNLEKINAVWYRKFGFWADNELEPKLNKKFNSDLIFYLKDEFSAYLAAFVNAIHSRERIKWLTHPFALKHSKSLQLITAQKYGLSTPDTIITNSKKALAIFYKSHRHSIITKSIRDVRHLRGDNRGSYHYIFYTKAVTKSQIQQLPALFYPSLFQEKIEKEFEVRSFFIDGRFYSMAIFSQNDKQTQVDFRKYNYQNMNRMVPYQLDRKIESKLRKVYSELKLDTGSADFIKGKDGKYYFLEINPTGQFGFVSFNCNYHIEKIVAKHLIKLDEKR